jgi:hypothetical protein
MGGRDPASVARWEMVISVVIRDDGCCAGALATKKQRTAALPAANRLDIPSKLHMESLKCSNPFEHDS